MDNKQAAEMSIPELTQHYNRALVQMDIARRCERDADEAYWRATAIDLRAAIAKATT